MDVLLCAFLPEPPEAGEGHCSDVEDTDEGGVVSLVAPVTGVWVGATLCSVLEVGECEVVFDFELLGRDDLVVTTASVREDTSLELCPACEVAGTLLCDSEMVLASFVELSFF